MKANDNNCRLRDDFVVWLKVICNYRMERKKSTFSKVLMIHHQSGDVHILQGARLKLQILILQLISHDKQVFWANSNYLLSIQFAKQFVNAPTTSINLTQFNRGLHYFAFNLVSIIVVLVYKWTINTNQIASWILKEGLPFSVSHRLLIL